MANQELTAAIQTTFKRSRGTYGAPRIHAELSSTGTICSLNRVARLMRKEGIQARRRKQYKVTTTNSRHSHPIAPNTLNRQFWASGPNQKWVGDITYIQTKEGWLYMAAILDIYSRRVVGWAMDKHMEQELVASALQMAAANGRCKWPLPSGGLARECCTTQIGEVNTQLVTTSSCLMLIK